MPALTELPTASPMPWETVTATPSRFCNSVVACFTNSCNGLLGFNAANCVSKFNCSNNILYLTFSASTCLTASSVLVVASSFPSYSISLILAFDSNRIFSSGVVARAIANCSFNTSSKRFESVNCLAVSSDVFLLFCWLLFCKLSN